MPSAVAGTPIFHVSADFGTRASSSAASTAALQGEINRDQLQLADWVTCVSAKTPKGKAAIQSLSSKFSAVKEQIVRNAVPTGANAAAAAATSAGASTVRASSAVTASASMRSSTATASSVTTAGRAGSVDVWA